ncbi:MAG: twitching motility protein PilT [Epulopiscium sp.]|jgi:hypothetical protein|nr:twitching motility protein PilT [Candidatus Epulonipiscium sp.]
MIQIIAGEKGEGKTKRLLDMANDAGKKADGHVVFIDDDKRHMYDLHYSIRFVDTNGFLMKDQNTFFGFICGILSQDRDIEKVYIDGLNNIVKDISNEELEHFLTKLDRTSQEHNVDFVMIISQKTETLPAKAKSYLI